MTGPEKKWEIVYEKNITKDTISGLGTWSVDLKRFKVKGKLGKTNVEFRRWLGKYPLRNAIKIPLENLEEFRAWFNDVVDKLMSDITNSDEYDEQTKKEARESMKWREKRVAQQI